MFKLRISNFSYEYPFPQLRISWITAYMSYEYLHAENRCLVWRFRPLNDASGLGILRNHAIIVLWSRRRIRHPCQVSENTHFPNLRGGASSILDIRNHSYEYPLRYCDLHICIPRVWCSHSHPQIPRFAFTWIPGSDARIRIPRIRCALTHSQGPMQLYKFGNELCHSLLSSGYSYSYEYKVVLWLSK